MSTVYQRLIHKTKKKKDHKRTPGLKQNPQVRGITMRARIVTPRKPNSARRPVAKIVLSNGKRVTSHIPGSGHNVRRHSEILVRGGGARDLPGVRYSCIRGVYDLVGVSSKIRRRSIYGNKLPPHMKKKLKRKYRNL